MQSRYYDPTTCRFINADQIILTEFGIVGYNKFAYCINNPVRYHDVCGYMPEEDCINEDPEETLFPDKDALGQPTKQTARSTNHNSSAAKGTTSSSARRQAVRNAWKAEQQNVRAGGRGLTRNWSPSEAEELLNTGKVSGYEGHHMFSVRGYPDQAGDPSNIQFLKRSEHLRAHGGNWSNITSERYIP